MGEDYRKKSVASSCMCMGEDYRKKSVTSGACVWVKITERRALHQVHVYDRMGEDYRKKSITSGACV